MARSGAVTNSGSSVASSVRRVLGRAWAERKAADLILGEGTLARLRERLGLGALHEARHSLTVTMRCGADAVAADVSFARLQEREVVCAALRSVGEGCEACVDALGRHVFVITQAVLLGVCLT